MAALSQSALDRALAAVFDGRDLAVALFRGAVEESARGYQRRPLTLGGPRTAESGARELYNVEAVVFAPFAQSAGAVDAWGIFDGDEEIAHGALQEPKALGEGDEYAFRAGMIRVGFVGSP